MLTMKMYMTGLELFIQELRSLGSFKHRQLLNFQDYCNTPFANLLIHDFLPGGSVHE
jgi:hypothetical protein